MSSKSRWGSHEGSRRLPDPLKYQAVCAEEPTGVPHAGVRHVCWADAGDRPAGGAGGSAQGTGPLPHADLGEVLWQPPEGGMDSQTAGGSELLSVQGTDCRAVPAIVTVAERHLRSARNNSMPFPKRVKCAEGESSWT